MSANAALVGVVAIQLWLATVFGLHRVAADRVRMALASLAGAVLGTVFAVAMVRVWTDEWNPVAAIAVVAFVVNTCAASVILTTRTTIDAMARRTRSLADDPQQPRASRVQGRVRRGWRQLSPMWKPAVMAASLWIIASTAITLNTSAAGNPIPAPLRILGGLLNLAAWVIVTVAAVKTWRGGRASS